MNLGYKVGQNCKDISFATHHETIAANPTDSTNPVPPAATKFTWNNDQITTFAGAKNTLTFKVQTGTKDADIVYGVVSDNACGYDEIIVLNAAGSNTGSYYELDDVVSSGPRGGASSSSNIDDFPQIKDEDVLKNPDKCRVTNNTGKNVPVVTIAGTKGTVAADPAGAGAVDQSVATCDTTPDPSHLNFIFCGILAAFDGIINVANDQIESQLTFNVSAFLPDNGGCPYRVGNYEERSHCGTRNNYANYGFITSHWPGTV